MLINYDEYQAMFEVEDKMWWYKILHERVISEIKAITPHLSQLNILDAGCGTGGLLEKLRNEGITSLSGFDFNQHAVEFSQRRHLPVICQSITKCAESYPKKSFDVIVSNDVFYQFDTETILQIFKNLEQLLKPGGYLITNNNAFKIFSGVHDIAVGSKQRFTRQDFDKALNTFPNLIIEKYCYWPVFLSPLILGVRFFQRLQLKLGLISTNDIKSDVSMPPNRLNTFFYNLCSLENKLLKKGPFGSSLFLVIKKT